MVARPVLSAALATMLLVMTGCAAPTAVRAPAPPAPPPPAVWLTAEDLGPEWALAGPPARWAPTGLLPRPGECAEDPGLTGDPGPLVAQSIAFTRSGVVLEQHVFAGAGSDVLALVDAALASCAGRPLARRSDGFGYLLVLSRVDAASSADTLGFDAVMLIDGGSVTVRWVVARTAGGTVTAFAVSGDPSGLDPALLDRAVAAARS